ncbi:MAG: sulfurtransferase FdhD [Saprospiraceae bacterium]|nr:MAG: sulfurtransferase FdhD [Saprospiraceae bacterium]
MKKQPTPYQEVNITAFAEGGFHSRKDKLAVEEPLEIQLRYGSATQRKTKSLAVTMRTPGQDEDLARGFLFTESIIAHHHQIVGLRHIGSQLEAAAVENVLLVELSPQLDFDFNRLNRHFYTSSSCGVCGKASLEMVQAVSCYFPIPNMPKIAVATLATLPNRLREAQPLFEYTGGMHAAGLFDSEGNLVLLREDVGRHNALDKVLGGALALDMLPLRHHVLLVSGRLSFELVQKAAMAGIPVLAAVGAPSSLAVELAEEAGMTLVGFLREGRFNVYCGRERVV